MILTLTDIQDGVVDSTGDTLFKILLQDVQLFPKFVKYYDLLQLKVVAQSSNIF